jgi:nicotinamide mononucleotide transporter
MGWIEWVATAFGLACVGLYVRQNVWSWPTGLVQVCLYAWIFYQAKLYSDALLQIVYVGLIAYGWWQWVRGASGQPELPVTRLTSPEAATWIGVALCGAGTLGFVMDRYTDASLPYWDAGIAAGSLVAQYLIAKKKLENWLFWIAVDIVAVGVYFAKDLYVTVGLYAVFLGMATAGWFAWRKSYRMTTRGADAGAGGSFSASSSRRTAGTSSSSTSPVTTAST